MPELGYTLSSEEHPPRDLVEFAVQAEQAGFSFAVISDHFHPWVDAQGQSPFVWSVLGAIAASTERLRLGTGVTCPTIRIHPAIIAQAAATTAALLPSRFFLSVGSGEALNEHITGLHFPPVDIRQEMLTEAVAVIRKLWSGGQVDHHGQYFTVENARIYSLPEQLPPIYVAASGKQAAEMAGKIGDGFVGTGPDRELIETFQAQGNKGPRMAQVTVCYDTDVEAAKKTAHRIWPNAALKGAFKMELPLPAYFEEAAANVTPEDVAKVITCGADPDAHLAAIDKYIEAGYDMVYIHQVGHDQQSFFNFYRDEILPRFRRKYGAGGAR
jgi:G6PDH family F420-dependent oxidoreductase